MQELVHQNHFVVYPNTFMVFKYLCNRANIQANRVFVSALPDNHRCFIVNIESCKKSSGGDTSDHKVQYDLNNSEIKSS